MADENIDRFQVKMDITVEDHIKTTSAKLVSLVRELEETLGKGRTHQIVSDWAEKNSINDVRNVVESLEKPVQDFEDVKALLRKWVKELNDDNIETVRIVKETADRSICHVTECVYAKVYNDLEAPDIGYLLHCKHDFAAAPAIHPKVDLDRSKTLMEKQDCCDFEYYWSSK